MMRQIAMLFFFIVLMANLTAFLGVAIPFWFVLLAALLNFTLTALWILRSTGDYFHPLVIFVFSFLVRLWFPAFLIMAGLQPLYFLGQNWWTGDAWQQGFILGSLANLSLTLAWILSPERLYKTSVLRQDQLFTRDSNMRAMYLAAWFWFIVGLFSYLVFFAINFGFQGAIDILIAGVLRGGEVYKAGTSRYIFLAGNFLRWSAAIITIIIYQTRGTIFGSLLPLLFVVLLFIPFGGRVVAIAPLFLGLIAIWYSGLRFNRLRKIIIILGLTLLFLALYIAPAVRAYRGGGGIQALLTALSPSVVFQDSILFWLELNMLHVYAYGVMLGPGSHMVSLLRYLFGGYTAYFLGVLNEMVHGTYIVWQVSGIKPDWGIHTGLPVDYYMSFGLVPMMGAMFLLGWILKLIYQRLVLSAPAYSVAARAAYLFLFWDIYWIVYERGLGVLSMYESLAFLLIILFTSRLLIRWQ